MAIDDDVFLAILAMDSYNRGYDEYIEIDWGQTNKLGTATLALQSDIEDNSAGVNASFFAQSYT